MEPPRRPRSPTWLQAARDFTEIGAEGRVLLDLDQAFPHHFEHGRECGG